MAGSEELRKELSNPVHDARQHYFSNTVVSFLKNYRVKFWRYVSHTKKSNYQINIYGMAVCDKTEMPHHFNLYFHSGFSAKGAYNSAGSSFRSLNSDFTSNEGDFSLLLNLNANSGCGPNWIPNAFLSRYAEGLSPFLVSIIRLTFSSSELRSDWRMARVVPFLKKVDRLSKVSNYNSNFFE